MEIKKALKVLWSQKWLVLAFCVFCFYVSDHAVIHSTECYESPCGQYPSIAITGMSFLAPTGLLSANIMMPVNYVDRSREGIYFHGGLVYAAATHAVVEDDLNQAEKQFVTSDDSKSFLTTSFIAHKIRVFFSFPWWIFLYWFLFIRLRQAIKRKIIYYPIVSVIIAVALLFGLFLKMDFGGGLDVTWQYLLNLPDKSADFDV